MFEDGAVRLELLAQADLAEGGDGVRLDSETGAQLEQLGRPLEDRDLSPRALERDGRSQSADAGTHDHHPVVAHVRSSRRPGDTND